MARDLREYLSEMQVPDGSDLIGVTLGDSDLEERAGLRVLGILRDENRLDPKADPELAAGDRVLVSGSLDEIVELATGDTLIVRRTASRVGDREHSSTELRTAEMLVGARSHAVGQSLRDLRRRLSDAVTVLAIERHGEELHEPISEIDLDPGDLLLFRGPLEKLQALHESGDFALLSMVELPPRRTDRMAVAVAILLGVVALAAIGVTTIMVAALLGMIAMVLTGCVRMDEVYDHVDWGVVILLGSLLALGRALETTGTAAYLAHGLLEVVRGLGPAGVLAAFYLLTCALTGLITNNAAALVLVPIAVATARDLGVSPMPLVVAVMFAASNSFASPVGYQTNTFIYAPGGYRFGDFIRVGGLLMLLLAGVATVVLPLFFPF
jgi:di/tricarboxylate transporter